MAEHSFDESIRLEPVEAGVLRGKTTAAWANMVGPFGGTTAATMLAAVLQHPERHRQQHPVEGEGLPGAEALGTPVLLGNGVMVTLRFLVPSF